MDQWLKTGTFSVMPLLINNFAEENTKKKLPLVSDTKIRKYSEEYLSHGFSFVLIENIARPECVVCGEVLSNGSMKPSLLTRHLNTKHSDLKDKYIIFFKRLLENKNKCNMRTYLSTGSVSENAVEASFQISYRKSGKNLTIGENLILPNIKDAVSCMFGEDYVHKINAIPLSNDTVSRRIKDISDDIEEIILKDIHDSPLFSIQVDESTDVVQLAALLVIAKYLKKNESVEELLLCHPLTKRATGADIFHVINFYFTEKSIKWSKCCGLSTDVWLLLWSPCASM